MLEKLTLSTVNPARKERRLRLVLLCTGKLIFFFFLHQAGPELTAHKAMAQTRQPPQKHCNQGGKAVVQDWGAASGLRTELCLEKTVSCCLNIANCWEQLSTRSRLGIPTLTQGDRPKNFSLGRTCQGAGTWGNCWEKTLTRGEGEPEMAMLEQQFATKVTHSQFLGEEGSDDRILTPDLTQADTVRLKVCALTHRESWPP